MDFGLYSHTIANAQKLNTIFRSYFQARYAMVVLRPRFLEFTSKIDLVLGPPMKEKQKTGNSLSRIFKGGVGS